MTEHTLKDAHRRGEIIHSPRRFQCSDDDGGGRDEVVGERVVEISL